MDATTKTLPTIRTLPPNLINQIAAGEVIERPASVVKELLENSIDAGANRVEVTITGGGSELIRIADDGCGMTAEQLPLAVSSHATSKLPDDDTLFHVGTLGFRGEAIASIGSVSHLLIRSRTHLDDSGSEITVRGGVIESPVPCGCPPGTVIEVRNLFFNTPVRHRFLKTAQTERGHIIEAFTRLALANPSVHFVLTSNDKQLYDLPASARWNDRIHAFFGAEISESLIPIHSDDAEVQIDGYVCDPAVSRGNNRMQYLFLNGRHIRDRALQHALGEAYRGMLMVGRHPICFLRMTMPAELIDVNVHPTKLEVRFTDSGRVYSRLLQSLRHQFLTTNLSQRVVPPTASEPEPNVAESATGLPVDVEKQRRQEIIDWARTGQPSGPRSVPDFKPFPERSGSDASMMGHASTLSHTPASSPQEPAPWDHQAGDHQAGDHLAGDRQTPAEHQTGPAASIPPNNETDSAPPSVSYLGFQVHNRYLVTQDESGMVVI
ncbi:MAG: DNA mismatch repair endonuclease MutL, partial [Planctomycetota bacterium]